jgi:radical SAM superfamily enzyme YgiQ (UPF0313 family)
MLDCLILIDHGVQGLTCQDALIFKRLREFYRFWEHRDPVGFRRLAQGDPGSPWVDSSFSLTGVVLATALQSAGHGSLVFDGLELPESCGEEISRVLRDGVLCVAVSTTYHWDADRTRAILKFVRDWAPSSRIIVGGQGLRSMHARTDLFETFPDADAFALGDGEAALPEVVARLRAGKDLGGIPGVCHRSNLVRSLEPAVVGLESVPVPTHALAFSPAYNPHLPSEMKRRSLYATVEEGRGCRFRCRFCSYPVNNPFRRKRPERLVKELQAAAAAGVRSVFLCGSDVMSSVEEVERLCRLIRQAGLGLHLSSYARLDLLNDHPHLAERLREAGWACLFCGVESGDPEILAGMGKPPHVEHIPEATRFLQRDLDIQVLASFIVGFPGECKRSVERTKELIAAANFYGVVLQGLSVYKDTPLYRMRDRFGLRLLNEHGDWEHRTMTSREVPAIIEDMVEHMTKTTEGTIEGLLNLAFLHLHKDDIDTASRLAHLLQEVIAIASLPTERRDASWEELLKSLRGLVEKLPTRRVEAVLARAAVTPSPWWRGDSFL